MTELFELKGKWALVTGGARRLGAAVCRALAAKGVRLVIHYHSSAADADALARELKASGAEAVTVAADLSRKEGYQSLVARAHDAAGRLDLLVNNASIFPSGTLDRLTETDLAANITVNAFAPLAVAREFAGQTDGGAIVNLLDARIVEHDRAHAAYHASKRLLADFTRLTALEFAPRVRVNAVAPGLILPPAGEGAEHFQARIKDVPLARSGTPSDVARAVVFLLESPFITGQVLFVDGGQRLKGDLYGM